ncbi:XRE family transcriptional regulator [Corynebacterium frankenforstense DSM 45800]|uniref:XRE family transcriptional regulator n=1 Tax=Corynebacterium frankenforstense DSM 45800 TaxID=1437875 RepID=A0A1L7CQR1_9CORY|nr:helix-turn-helix domain-containing protein [Corynebacterium frankenforstense]APT88195.1 XRE family transcriptional regulator [Corynebacterium frankenforstense DSM 45800]
MSAPRRKTGKPAGDIPELVQLGSELAERRRELGRLQQDVAATAGVSRSTLHAIEHGATGVRWEKVQSVARVLGLELCFAEASGAAAVEAADAEPAEATARN